MRSVARSAFVACALLGHIGSATAGQISNILEAEDAARMVGTLTWCEQHTEDADQKEIYRSTRARVEHELSMAIESGILTREAADFLIRNVVTTGRSERIAVDRAMCDVLVSDLASLPAPKSPSDSESDTEK